MHYIAVDILKYVVFSWDTCSCMGAITNNDVLTLFVTLTRNV